MDDDEERPAKNGLDDAVQTTVESANDDNVDGECRLEPRDVGHAGDVVGEVETGVRLAAAAAAGNAADVSVATEDGCLSTAASDDAELSEAVARERASMEKEFDLKRARFVELFKQKEIELSEAKKVGDEAVRQRDQLNCQLRKLQDELDECKSQVAIAEFTAENLVDEEKRKYRDEIASMHQIIKETMAETEALNKDEIARLKRSNDKLEAEVHELRTSVAAGSAADSVGKEGVLSAMTKTLAKRVSSLNAYSQSIDNVHENLEDGMKKAQEDAEVLRSLVVPLEEEIKALKEKLRAADDQLRSHEQENALGRSTVSLVTEADPESSVVHQRPQSAATDGDSEMDEKLKGLHKGLQAEKSSRSDLEMYVSVLQSQKAMLQTEADGLRKELTDVCQRLDKEMREHRELKQTWQMANDKFLECQMVQSDELRRLQNCMQTVLTGDQLKTIAELQKKIPTVADGVVDSGQSDSRRPSPTPFPSSSPRLRNSLSPARQSIDDNDKRLAVDSAALVASSEGGWRESSDGRASSADSIDEQSHFSGTPGIVCGGPGGSSDPTKLPDSEEGVRSSQSRGKRSADDLLEEIHLLQEELRCLRDRSNKPCDMCSNYEAQLQRAQERNVEIQRKTKSLEKSIEWHLSDLRDVQRAKQELEEKLLHVSTEMQDRLAELYKKTEDAERMQSEARRSCAEFVQSAKERFHELAANRAEMQAELDRLQRRNDTLEGKYSAHSQQMQSEEINLPDAIEDMQFLLLGLREELINEKVAKEHLGDSLRSEMLFLKEQLIGEQQSRESNDRMLTQECDSLRQEVAALEGTKAQLAVEQSVRSEVERTLRELKHRYTENETKQKHLRHDAVKKYEEVVKIKDRLESELLPYRMKVQQLQTDLDNSEAVQKDFVKLSQSLQVQLEKIRESVNEVRWQHDEDVDDCSNCKQPFTGSRRKNHCRHCGRIFCLDCTSKVVLSGPMGRPSKVCDVCHTLLVPDMAPYFSTEPPHTPD